MALGMPTTRDAFKQYVLSRLGDGAIRVNVTDTQVENRIDFAIRKAMDYHVNYSEKVYLSIQITDDIQTNRYIDLPDNIIGAVDIFDLSSVLMGSGIFSARYQFVIDNFRNWTAWSVTPYFMAFQNLRMIDQMLTGQQPIRYNRFTNRIYIDMDWNIMNVGEYIIIRAYEVIDPDTYTRMWGDIWLIEYATAQVKQQWGEHLKKYGNQPLPGGIVLNGKELFDEATAEIVRLEDQLISSFSLPSVMILG